MEPRREEPQKALEPGAVQKPKRFRIVKLEERIAPTQPYTKGAHCYTNKRCTVYTYAYCCW